MPEMSSKRDKKDAQLTAKQEVASAMSHIKRDNHSEKGEVYSNRAETFSREN